MLHGLPDGYRSFPDAAPYPDYYKHGSPKGKPQVARTGKFDGWHFIDYPMVQDQDLAQPKDVSVEGNGDNILYGIRESI